MIKLVLTFQINDLFSRIILESSYFYLCLFNIKSAFFMKIDEIYVVKHHATSCPYNLYIYIFDHGFNKLFFMIILLMIMVFLMLGKSQQPKKSRI